jgi:catechol-2,3-dioxygenase
MIRRLNHAVLWVRDAPRAARFYVDVLGFTVVNQMGDQAVFLRAADSTNDHDLGLFGVGDRPAAARHSPGLYHLAWQVDTIDQLVTLRARLVEHGALVGESDHGVSKSLYAVDPDGIEFEVMWATPVGQWPAAATLQHLDLAEEQRRWAGVKTAAQME